MGQVTTCVVVWIEIQNRSRNIWGSPVTTCVVVWIEIFRFWTDKRKGKVTTCVVVWIEIINLHHQPFDGTSPPAWWCGLKFR